MLGGHRGEQFQFARLRLAVQRLLIGEGNAGLGGLAAFAQDSLGEDAGGFYVSGVV